MILTLRRPSLMLLATAMSVFVSCSEKPQRISMEESEAVEESSGAATALGPARFAGTVLLTGSLARADRGSLFLIVREPGSTVPSLARKYEIGDPAFSAQEGARVLHFALDERDDMDGPAAPMVAEMEVEARFDPDGFVDTSEGVVRARVRARPGDREIALVLVSDESPGGTATVAGSPEGS